MVPLWQRKRSEVTKEEYDTFYKTTFQDDTPPLETLTVSVEGIVSYDAPDRGAVLEFAGEMEKAAQELNQHPGRLLEAPAHGKGVQEHDHSAAADSGNGRSADSEPSHQQIVQDHIYRTSGQRVVNGNGDQAVSLQDGVGDRYHTVKDNGCTQNGQQWSGNPQGFRIVVVGQSLDRGGEHSAVMRTADSSTRRASPGRDLVSAAVTAGIMLMARGWISAGGSI